MAHLSLLFIFVSWSYGIPDLNEKIIEYVDTVVGKKVAYGECWDLAAAALDHAGAYLDRGSQKSIYIFGKPLKYKKDQIFPGDIMQLENVKLEYTVGNSIHTETMLHHTAIIYKVMDSGHFQLAHQNTSFSGRKVGISEFNMEHMKSGKIIFYRPYKKH